jgi:hypothetical protein
MKNKTKHCISCGASFQATNAWHKYCSDNCKQKHGRISRGIYKLIDGRFCKQCGTRFYPLGTGGNNKHHCSAECSSKSARESRSKFYEKNPHKKDIYYKKSREKNGVDGNMKRFLKRFPDAPQSCESCGDSRVLDIAHKPEYKRNGEWRSVANTTIEKVWILCPTCHALLDRKGYTPEELGLK